jgi:hypothetical protein
MYMHKKPDLEATGSDILGFDAWSQVGALEVLEAN